MTGDARKAAAVERKATADALRDLGFWRDLSEPAYRRAALLESPRPEGDDVFWWLQECIEGASDEERRVWVGTNKYLLAHPFNKLHIFLAKGLIKATLHAIFRKVAAAGATLTEKVKLLDAALKTYGYWSNGRVAITSGWGGIVESTTGLKRGKDFLSLMLHTLAESSADYLGFTAKEQDDVARIIEGLLYIYSGCHGPTPLVELEEIDAFIPVWMADFNAVLGRYTGSGAVSAIDSDNADLELNTYKFHVLLCIARTMRMWGAGSNFSLAPFEFRQALMKAIAGLTCPGKTRAEAVLRKSTRAAVLQHMLVIVDRALAGDGGFLALVGDSACHVLLPAPDGAGLSSLAEPAAVVPFFAAKLGKAFDGIPHVDVVAIVAAIRTAAGVDDGATVDLSQFFAIMHLKRYKQDGGKVQTEGQIVALDVIRPCAGYVADDTGAALPSRGSSDADVSLVRVAGFVRASVACAPVADYCVGHRYVELAPAGVDAPDISAVVFHAAAVHSTFSVRPIGTDVVALPLAAVYDNPFTFEPRIARAHGAAYLTERNACIAINTRLTFL